MPTNNAKKWAVISIFLFILGIGMVAAGIIIDSYDFYWMIFVGLILGLTFFICMLMFLGQARRLDGMFQGRDLLARWHFDMSQQMKKAETEYKEQKARNKILLIIITLFFVVIGGLFVIFGFDDIEDAGMFIAIMGSVLGLIILVAVIAPGAAYRKMKKSIPEVFVGPYSAWVMGQYVQWKAPMTKIRSVKLLSTETGAVIDVEFMIWQRYGYQQHNCRIPAPDGYENEARDVAMKIASINGVGYSESASIS